MTRIAIIDHSEHELMIEDISNEDLAKYNGSEEDYIKDNYDLELFSWDYITDIQYFPINEKIPYEIKPSEML